MKSFCFKGTAAFLLAALFAGVLSGTRPAYAESLEKTVSAVEKHYQDLSTLTANVLQKNFLKSLEKTQTFEGTLWIKKPGRLRLEYTNGQLILVDGKKALLYSKKNEQLVKKTFTDFAQMNIPVAFLLGAGHIADDFDAVEPDQKKPGRIELIPKKPGATMKRLGLTTDQEGRITELVIHDKSGNVTELLFRDLKEGAALDDKLFTFKPPKGTEIIEQ